MGELVDRDLEHLRLLKGGFYIMAGITGLFTLFSLLYLGLGGLFASGAIPMKEGSTDDPRMMGLIFLVVGVGFLVIGLAITFLAFATGRNLRDRRNRTFCLVIAGLSCLQIPWGTVIGVCTISVLNRPSVKALFEPPGAVVP